MILNTGILLYFTWIVSISDVSWTCKLTSVPCDGHAKSWHLGVLFSRPGKSWKITSVLECHGKVIDNDSKVAEFFRTAQII